MDLSTSLNCFCNPGPNIFHLSSLRAVIKITWKMSRLSMFNYPNLYLSVYPAILKIQQQKRK